MHLLQRNFKGEGDEQHVYPIPQVLKIALLCFSKRLLRSGKEDTDNGTKKSWCSRHQN